LLVLVTLSLATMVLFDRPLIRGDGIAYLAWADTLLLDHDVNFDNQLERLAPVNTYQIGWSDEQQRFVNVFPFGVAFVQAPFFLTGNFFARQGWWDVNPDYFHQMQGLSAPYSYWLMIGANLLALATIVLSWMVGRRLCGEWSAAFAAWALFLGTPLFYYSTVTPLNSHNPGAFAVAAFLLILATIVGLPGRVAHRRTARWPWLLLGLVAGMMVLIRWQLLLVVAGGFAMLLWERRWRGALLAVLVAGLVILPLPIIWQAMFGRPFVVPYEASTGSSFLSAPSHTLWVLRELLRNSPVLLLSLIGLPLLWFVDRRWAILTAGVILLEAVVNGAVLDWWGGESYGVRRMSELYPFYVLLACVALGYGTRFAAQWSRWWPVLAHSLLAVLVIYSIVYILAFFSYTWTNPDGTFIAGPRTMLAYFADQPDRWRVLTAVLRAHVGPVSWHMPGP
jgi:hypothetical protein